MAKNNNFDTRSAQIGQDQSFDIPATGALDRDDFKDAFEIVDGPTGMDKAEMLKFMDENVQVRLMDVAEPNAAQIVQFSVNGVSQFMVRGKTQTIKRKFLEVMARAKTMAISTPEITDANGNRTTRIVKAYGSAYPFQVISDRNPKGAAWLEKILQEA
jgi:hypothetical protein